MHTRHLALHNAYMVTALNFISINYYRNAAASSQTLNLTKEKS